MAQDLPRAPHSSNKRCPKTGDKMATSTSAQEAGGRGVQVLYPSHNLHTKREAVVQNGAYAIEASVSTTHGMDG